MPSRGLIVFAAIWVVALGFGMGALHNFASTPGNPGAPLPTWPRDTRLVPSHELATLVMLAHPHCPCTGASLGELAKLMTRLKGQLVAHVVFVQPRGAAHGWGKTDIASRAEAIPGVEVHVDRDGAEARRFGAKTSGQTLVYDAGGTLRFSGGITGARGHEGDNAGEDDIVELIEHATSSQTSSRVLGCALFDANAAPAVRTP